MIKTMAFLGSTILFPYFSHIWVNFLKHFIDITLWYTFHNLVVFLVVFSVCNLCMRPGLQALIHLLIWITVTWATCTKTDFLRLQKPQRSPQIAETNHLPKPHQKEWPTDINPQPRKAPNMAWLFLLYKYKHTPFAFVETVKFVNLCLYELTKHRVLFMML